VVIVVIVVVGDVSWKRDKLFLLFSWSLSSHQKSDIGNDRADGEEEVPRGVGVL
jgi:hypothetical protein